MGRRAIGLVFLIAFCGLCAVAEEQPPSVEAGILTRDGIGARAIGLGSAFTAVADDTTAGYYNPAGLAVLEGIRTGGMYESKFDPALGTSFQYLSGTYLLESIGLGAGLTFVQRSDTGIQSGSGIFSAYENMVLVSAGWDAVHLASSELLSALSIGGSFKVFSFKGFDQARAQGIGLDLAALVGVDLELGTVSFGYRTSDIANSRIQWSGTRNEITEYVPWGHHIGMAIALRNIALRASVDFSFYPSDTSVSALKAGVEYSLFGFSLRAGVNDAVPVVGVGFSVLEWLTIDVAMAFHQGLGRSLIASTEINF